MAHHSDPHCCLILISPDETLRLLVRKQEGDLSVRFEGYPWHIHTDMLLAEYETEVEEEAVGFFVRDVLTGQRQIVVLRKGGIIVDAWVDHRPDSPFYRDPHEDPYLEPDEVLEVRRWL